MLELNPGFVKTYIKRARAHKRINNNQEAIQDYTRAIELKSGFRSWEVYEWYVERGECLEEIRNYCEALEDYTRAIELLPTTVEAYVSRGCLHIKLNHWAAATRDLAKIIRGKPRVARWYYWRGFCFYRLIMHEKAAPDDPRGYAKSAIEDFTRAIELEKAGIDPFYDTLSRSYAYRACTYANGFSDYKSATQDLTLALEECLIKEDETWLYKLHSLYTSKINKDQKD